MEKLTFPEVIIRNLRNNAPSYTVSENSGRRSGYYEDTADYAKGYKSICIYVQNGLANYIDLFNEIAKGIFKIQANNRRRYPLLVFGFGNTDQLQHEKKFFDFGYSSDRLNSANVASTMARISGQNACNHAVIPQLFPKTDFRSLYTGKTKIEQDDLLVIIGRTNEVFLDESNKDKVQGRLLKRVLFVEISVKDVLFRIKEDIPLQFKSLPNPIITNPMTTTTFKRNFSGGLINSLKAEKLYNLLETDCKNGPVFPAIRNEIIDFYHKGGRLFQYDKKGFKTHIKYAAVIPKDEKDYMTESELNSSPIIFDFKTNYKRIKENCANYAKHEAAGVSEIYHNYSYIKPDLNMVVLDIEVSLKSNDPESKQDRIDLLLFNKKEQKLKFVEAKHYSNSEIWSETEAKVISQVERYEDQIRHKKAELINEYNKYITTVNNLFSLNLPSVNDIDEKVTLLVFGYDSDQEKGRLNTLITDEKTIFREKNIVVYKKGEIKKIIIENLWKAK